MEIDSRLSCSLSILFNFQRNLRNLISELASASLCRFGRAAAARCWPFDAVRPSGAALLLFFEDIRPTVHSWMQQSTQDIPLERLISPSPRAPASRAGRYLFSRQRNGQPNEELHEHSEECAETTGTHRIDAEYPNNGFHNAKQK